MFRVSVYYIETNEDPHLPDGFSLGDAAHCLVAYRSPSPTHRLVAAQGWVKCVGLTRGSYAKTHGASANIVAAYASAKGVLEWHDLTPAPRFLCPPDYGETTHWILDNCIDSWLISVTRLPTRVQPV
jgi:hypothetical protein